MASTSRARLVPDPSIHVLDLEQAVSSFCRESGSFDVGKLIMPEGKEVTWRTAPNAEWLAQLAPLFMKLVLIAKNLVLPSKKMKLCLSKFQPLGFSLSKHLYVSTFFLGVQKILGTINMFWMCFFLNILYVYNF